jgi:hypothetical protein
VVRLIDIFVRMIKSSRLVRCRAAAGHGRMGTMGGPAAGAARSLLEAIDEEISLNQQVTPRGPQQRRLGRPRWSATVRTNSRQMKR